MSHSSGWVHLFPEGKVNYEPLDKQPILPFRWGISRLIMESHRDAIVLPIYHMGMFFLLVSFSLIIIGMDDVLPQNSHIPRLFKRVTVGFGEPVDVKELLKSHGQTYHHEHEIRSALTQDLWQRMDNLRIEVEKEHVKV